MINKKYAKDMIHEHCKKNQIKSGTIKYLDRLYDSILYAIIETVNQEIDAGESPRLGKDDIQEALFLIDEYYGLGAIDDLNFDEVKINGEPQINLQGKDLRHSSSSSEGESIDINLNINVNDEE